MAALQSISQSVSQSVNQSMDQCYFLTWTKHCKLGVMPVMVYRCLHGQAPRYLAGHLIHPACSSPPSSTICQQELSHCAPLSTQHVRLSGVRLRQPHSLELAARWT